MQITMNHLLILLALVLVAGLSYKVKALSLSGGLATIVVGIVIFQGFGLRGLVLIGVFFVTSSFWSKFKQERKKAVEERNEKSGRRDGVQVLANGFVPAIISLLFIFFQKDFLLFMYIAALATANSDTWASEIGSLSSKKPVHVLSLKKVEAGTSGAMSLLGTTAALSGALAISFVSYFMWNDVSLKLALFIGLCGFIGNLIDTLLGATVQVTYICTSCALVTEKKLHCGQKTEYKKGLPIFNNEVVNFLAVLCGALLVVFIT